MTERWQSELERLERLHPDEDLLERPRHRPLPPTPSAGPGSRVGAIIVASFLTVGLAVGGYVVLSGRSPATNPVASPPEVIENGDLLFARSTDDGWHIVRLDPDTGEVLELTDGVRDYSSDWSPDGARIVYDTDDGGIVVANADGTDPIRIADGESPAWSPDGSRIAYTLEGRIWVANADGSDAHAVTDGPDASGETVSFEAGYDWNPTWSPDGRSIAYTRLVSERLAPLPSGEGGTSVTLEELRVWTENGSDVALTDDYTYLGPPDWSPDGSTIVFTGGPTLFEEESTNGMVWPRLLTIHATGGVITPISPERDRWIDGAAWSPDGRWIAFQDDYETIAIVRPDGSGRSEIRLGYEVIGLSWGVRPAEG